MCRVFHGDGLSAPWLLVSEISLVRACTTDARASINVRFSVFDDCKHRSAY